MTIATIPQWPGALILTADQLAAEDLVSVNNGPRAVATTLGSLGEFLSALNGDVVYVSLSVSMSALEVTAAIQSAIDFLSGRRGVIVIPPGSWPVTAPVATRVAVDEGSAFILTASNSNLVFMGWGIGVSILAPVSNKIEMFAINGAPNTQFMGLTFDNSANGLLQNQVAPSVRGGPNTGVAGQGNAANCAIRQYEGTDLTVRNCSFSTFIISVGYIGSFANQAVLVGTLIGEGCNFDACVQGLIPEQPRHVRMTNCRYDNGVESVNFSGSNDPGHGIYLSNRLGAYPETVIVSGIQGTNNWGEIVRIRKGQAVTCSDIAVDASHRGINFENCMTLTVTNCSLRLADIHDVDNNAAAVFVVDCGSSEFGNITMDTSNTNAYGFRLAPGGSVAAWANKRVHIHDVTQTDDRLGDNAGKDWNIFSGYDDLKIENFTAFLTAATGNKIPILNIVSGARPITLNVSRRAEAVGNPTGSDYLIELGATVTNARVTYNRTNLSVPPTANTVVNLGGADNIILRNDGVQSDIYLPVVTFATNGDFAPTYARQQGDWTLKGDRATVNVSLIFTTNAYTTASGNFQIRLPANLQATAGSSTIALWAVGAGNFQNIVFGANANIEVLIPAASSGAVALLRTAFTTNAGSYLGTASVPASTASISVTFQISYKIAET